MDFHVFDTYVKAKDGHTMHFDVITDKKKTEKAAPEYSTWKPATISDSPSATSNGARFVSASPEIM